MGEIPRAEPSATPRVGFAGEATRGTPIFEDSSSAPPWQVQVVPLEYVTVVGRSLTGGRPRPRATFEVRVEFEGDGLEDFEPVDGKVRRIEQWHTEDLERARAVAIAAAELLRAGRDVVLVQLAARFPAA
jgi:hypothetical protein